MPKPTLNGQSLQLAELEALLQGQPGATPSPLALIKIRPGGKLELACEQMHQPTSRTVLRHKGSWTYGVRMLGYARGPSGKRIAVCFAATWHEVLLAQADHQDIYVAVKADLLNCRMLATPQAA